VHSDQKIFCCVGFDSHNASKQSGHAKHVINFMLPCWWVVGILLDRSTLCHISFSCVLMRPHSGIYSWKCWLLVLRDSFALIAMCTSVPLLIAFNIMVLRLLAAFVDLGGSVGFGGESATGGRMKCFLQLTLWSLYIPNRLR
jgi:hypothetical protein